VNIALTVLHVLACLVLIAVVLLQRGKGAEMGAVFGGGASSTVFGSRGAGNFLTKLTTGCAVVFMLTSLSLSYIGTQNAGDQLFEGGVIEAPADEADDSPFEQLGTVDPEPASDLVDVVVAPPSDAAASGEAGADDPAADGGSETE
jgi:preprotein translocase subunit SecG